MTDLQGFLGGLGATVVLLLVVIATGHKHKRGPHLAAVLVYLGVLGLTIYFAERMGRTLDLEKAGWITPVHLAMAKLTVVLYVLPISTGVATWRDGRWRARHKLCAWGVIVMTLATVATGTWMALAAR